MSSRVESPTQALAGHSLLRLAGWMIGSNLLAQVFAYGSLILLARWLAPATFGTIAIATAVIGIGGLFVDQGTWGAVIVERQLTRPELVRAFRRSLATAVVLGAAMVATSGALTNRFATGGHPGAVAAIAVCLPLHAIAVVPTALLQRAMQFRRLATVNGVANVISALCAVILASVGAGIWALVSRQVVLYGMIAVLSAALCLPALRAHVVPATETAPVRSGVRTEWWFFLFSVAKAVTGSLDKLVVGVFGSAAAVGLYSMASTIAMAPLTQFSSQAGQVLFAAAASRPYGFSERTERSARLMAMLMLPLIPVGVLLAPALLPAVLGTKWAPAVPVFQVLLIVGVGNAIVNCIAEPITGMGWMPFRTRIMLAQCLATLLALLILVPADGIRGAALAELLVFVPYAAIYFTGGARRAQSSLRSLWRAMRPAFVGLAFQILLSTVLLLALIRLGVSGVAATCSAAIAGLAAGAPILWRELAAMRSSW